MKIGQFIESEVDEDLSVIQRAEIFAQQAHEYHQRKYTGDPYYLHLDEVRRIVKVQEVVKTCKPRHFYTIQ